MLEKDFWTIVRKGIGSLWRAQRVEDELASDVPDVVFSIPANNRRVMGMIEIKVQAPNKKGCVNARHYTQGQRDFAQMHGAVFMLVLVGDWVMLFDSNVSNEILRGQTIQWHIERALYSSITPDWSRLISAIKTALLV